MEHEQVDPAAGQPPLAPPRPNHEEETREEERIRRRGRCIWKGIDSYREIDKRSRKKISISTKESAFEVVLSATFNVSLSLMK